MERYKVVWSPTQRHCMIVDRDLWDHCWLPGSAGQRIYLRFYSDSAARRWLHACYRAWGCRPKLGGPHPADAEPVQWWLTAA